MRNRLILLCALVVPLFVSSCGQKPNAAEQETAEVSADDAAGSLQTTDGASNTTADAFPGYSTQGLDTVTSPSGLKIIYLNKGEGEQPKAGAEVAVHYTGYLTDGTKFDSSVDKGQPLQFRVGTGMVIRGWDEGISKLAKGGKARLVVPAELGYGEQGYPGVIPPMATLIFDVELVDILN